MKIKSLKMKNDKRFVLVGKGWKELDPKKVIVPSLFMYLSKCAQDGPLAIALFDSLSAMIGYEKRGLCGARL